MYYSPMKTCKKCLAELPIEEFYKHAMMADGRLSFRKTCVRGRVKHHRNKNIERIRAYDRARGYRLYDPAKARARAELYNAVRRGEIKKSPCWCGAAAQAHHDDYSKPLDVKWLCPRHHGEEHCRMNGAT